MSVIQAVDGGFFLRARLTPNASADTIDGADKDAAGTQFLKIRVRAVPEKGKANKAAIALLSKALGLPKSAIELTSGETSRMKRFHITDSGAMPRAKALLQGAPS